MGGTILEARTLLKARTVLEATSDLGITGSLDQSLGATVAFLGAGRELISRRLEPPFIPGECNPKTGYCKVQNLPVHESATGQNVLKPRLSISLVPLAFSSRGSVSHPKGRCDVLRQQASPSHMRQSATQTATCTVE